MTENSDDKKIREIVDSFEVAMKKGFISGLILMVLEKEPGHGYKIMKEIDRRTFGFWHPQSSNIYPLLDSISKKGLIECIEVEESGRSKKIYGITPKGKETLKMLLQKHSMMLNSIRSMMLSTLDITDIHDPSFLEDLEKLISFPGIELMMEDSSESKMELLRYNKEMIKKRLKIMNSNLQIIENILSKLEEKAKNEEINQKSQNFASLQSQK